ncbi:hypothetical protein ACIBU0_35630 [Streptomyces sp. NPDC049627]|uniref:hypothetical protein n=1 Tax=Streptomyces sp. NPDC049627 TaxID=3365595 RepID=UPI0037B31C03
MSVLRIELASVCPEEREDDCSDGVKRSEQRDGARRLLVRAEKLIDSAGSRQRGLWERIHSWWNGELYEGALKCLHEAEVLIVGLYEPHRALRHAQSVLATAKPICRGDSRVAQVEQLLGPSSETPPSPVGETPNLKDLPAALAALLGAAYAVEEERGVRSRNFRNRLIRAGLVLSILLGVVVGVAFAVDGSIPVCDVIGERKTTNCIGSDAPSGQDTGVVMLLGMLGAGLPMIARLQRMGGSWNPYSLPFWQEMIKLPTGALTAVAGLVLVDTDWLPFAKPADTWREVIAYAIAFGVGQLAFTHALDKRTEKLLAADPDMHEAEQLENVPSKKADR